MGGKYRHLGWLLPLLPKCHHFVDLFGGAGSVILNRPPSPIETYNDIDGELVNFFSTLREQPDELIRMLELTPYSREEFVIAASKSTKELANVEKARRFFVKIEMCFGGTSKRSTQGDWSYCKTQSHGGVAGCVNMAKNKVGRYPEIVNRLLDMQIENSPAIKVIKRMDTEDTLFYCDPPYVIDARRGQENIYAHEMSDEQHVELAIALNKIVGKAAISGYPSALYDDLYKGWYKTERLVNSTKPHGCNKATEVLWTNYDTADTATTAATAIDI